MEAASLEAEAVAYQVAVTWTIAEMVMGGTVASLRMAATTGLLMGHQAARLDR